MNVRILPPGPTFRMWKGSKVRVTSMYSVAGISTSFFLDTAGGSIQMEAGDGCTRDIIEIRRNIPDDDGKYQCADPVNGLHAVIISHTHYDHYSGLLNLLNFLHLMGKRSELNIIYPAGPENIKNIVDHFLDTLWEKCPFAINIIEALNERHLTIDEFGIDTIPVIHRNSRPGSVGGRIEAMAYSISYGGERITYSGDTCGSLQLEELVEDSDLAIIEATYDVTPGGQEEVHMGVDEAIRIGSLARKYWLSHFTGSSYQRIIDDN